VGHTSSLPEKEKMKKINRYYRGVWKEGSEYYFKLPNGTYWWCHPGSTDYSEWSDGFDSWKNRYRSHKLKDSNGEEIMRFYPVERLEIIVTCGKLCPMDKESGK